MDGWPDQNYVSDDPERNMRHFLPSRKRRRPGDLFAYQMPDGWWGYIRFVKTDCAVVFFTGLNLLYIYRYRTPILEVPNRIKISRDDLLIPPQLTNNLGWVRGYFLFLTHLPIQDGEVFDRHCFWSELNHAHYDEFSNRVAAPFDPLGSQGVASYSLIDLRVSRALGIPHPHDLAKDGDRTKDG